MPIEIADYINIKLIHDDFSNIKVLRWKMSKKIEDVYPELNENQYIMCWIDNKGNLLTEEDLIDVDLDTKEFIMALPAKISLFTGFKMMNGDFSNMILPDK